MLEISGRHSTKILKFSWWFSLQFDEHVLHALSGNNKRIDCNIIYEIDVCGNNCFRFWTHLILFRCMAIIHHLLFRLRFRTHSRWDVKKLLHALILKYAAAARYNQLMRERCYSDVWTVWTVWTATYAHEWFGESFRCHSAMCRGTIKAELVGVALAVQCSELEQHAALLLAAETTADSCIIGPSSGPSQTLSVW
jgi:hypothetical protein